MGQDNTTPRRINRLEGAAGQVILSGGLGAVETWGTPVPAVHSAAQHTDITREIFLPACEGYIAAGSCTTFGPGLYSLVLGGADVDEPIVHLTMKVPVDFVSFTSVKAIWLAGTGNMRWLLGATYAACTESFATHADNPAPDTTASGGEVVFNCQEPANPLALASLAVGDILGLKFFREGSHGDDTLDAAMFLCGLLFTYVANQ